MAYRSEFYLGDRNPHVDETDPLEIRYPSTWNPVQAEAAWDEGKEKAKAAGMSVLEWLGETAFQGSQNPQGFGQEVLGAISYPFRKTAEVGMDYVLPMEGPDTWFQSENLPSWLSNLNDPRVRELMLSKGYGVVPATAALMGGLGIPVNKWAEGEDVLKGDVLMGAATLAGPVVAGAVKGSTKLGAKLAPKTAGKIEENVDAARRRFIQGLGASAGLISAGAVGTKALVGKAVVPVAKAARVVTAVSAVTTGLAGKVFRNLHTLIQQTPSGGYPKIALNRGGQTVVPSPGMAEKVGDTISTQMHKDLWRPENRNILNFFNKLFDKSDYADIGSPSSLKSRGWTDKSGTTDVEWKTFEDIEGYRVVDDLIGKEEKILIEANKNPWHVLPYGGKTYPKGMELDDVAYVDYHLSKSGNLSSDIISFEQATSVVDTLAKTDPAKLVRILNEVIDESEGTLASIRKALDANDPRVTTSGRTVTSETLKDTDTFYFSGPGTGTYPLAVNVGENRAFIKMAKELLEALE